MSDETAYGVAVYGNKFRVHLVSFYHVAFHWLESACSHVQCHLVALNAVGVDVGEYSTGEVKAGSRSCHTAFYLGINGLVCGLVALLRVSV